MNTKYPKKVIIFGASGFIGHRIAEDLRGQDVEVIAHSSKEGCDLLKYEDASMALEQCDCATAIIFASAVTRQKEDSAEAASKNITMAQNLISAIITKKAHSLLFMSSADVYGIPPATLPICETIGVNPKGYYGISKYVSEKMLELGLRHTCPVTILRLPGIYGNGDRYQSLIGMLVKEIINGEKINIYGNDLVRRDLVEVRDLSYIACNFVKKPFNGVVNVATGVSFSLKDIIETIADISGRVFRAEHLPAMNAQGDLEFDITRLRSLCPGIKLRSIKEGIADYLKDIGASKTKGITFSVQEGHENG